MSAFWTCKCGFDENVAPLFDKKSDLGAEPMTAVLMETESAWCHECGKEVIFLCG